MPNGDYYSALWIFSFVLAGKTNDGGFDFFQTKCSVLNSDAFSIFQHPTIYRGAGAKRLCELQTFGDSEGIIVANWEKHQNTKGLEKIREQLSSAPEDTERLKELSDGRNIPNNSSNNEHSVTRHVTSPLRT